MSKVEELLAKYNSNGVKKIILSSIGDFENIGVDKKTVEGEPLVTLLNYVDVYHNKTIKKGVPQMTVSSPINKVDKCSVEQGDIFITPTSETVDDIGHSALVLETLPQTVYSYHIMRYRLHNVSMTTASYINQCFESCYVKQQILKKAQGLTRFGVSKSKFGEIEIPLPHIKVQEEIVKILDSFTNLIDALNEELSLRQKQFEYYREKLLTFDESNYVKISSICKRIVSGGTPKTTIDRYYQGNIPWLRTEEVDFCYVYETKKHITEEAIANSSTKMIPVNCVIIAMYGATAAKCCINKIPLCTNQACCNLEIDDTLALYKFVFYNICKEYEKLKSLGEGSQNNISGQKIKDYRIPIPSLAIQQSIVEKLDAFESLISSLKEEIALRQKQYEYYREKLLTFD